ncbi:metallophosphoesterase family protein [Desulfopila aestuarii]|uniref:Serine/threonine protein phosphatase 1 n=1 Tax=Desulfopila aestuarii DSM 18488 TaxID=1121416 RepID=A0A1M7XVH0_9BACT|nr:metallophosphoesterase family protein [Desulfopila aestuarii]SHO42539.1 serine/threonine protein phosphatase 1 [Desulfopila aestuarii DSM 18488]
MPTAAPRIFAVGDIHGCFNKLETLLKRLPFHRETDTLVFLGDYINRGPDSKKVLDLLIEVKETCSNAIFLKGNHEQALLEYHATGNADTLSMLREMGIAATIDSFGSTVRQLQGLSTFSSAQREFLLSLAFAYIADKTVFTHADINMEIIGAMENGVYDQSDNELAESMLLSSRRLTMPNAATYGYTMVFGHTPFELPLVLPDRIGIDTGAVYGNFLTAVELPARNFYHA